MADQKTTPAAALTPRAAPGNPAKAEAKYPGKYLRVRAARVERSFYRGGLEFKKEPRYLDEADLDALGVEKINMILGEQYLFCEWVDELPKPVGLRTSFNPPLLPVK